MTAATERAAVDGTALAHSRAYCRNLTRRAAKNFYYGLKLLPEPKRSAMYALYAYMRLVDDIADDDGAERTVDERRKDLDRWEELTRQAAGQEGDGVLLYGDVADHQRGRQCHDDLVWPAFVDMVRMYRVPASVFQDMIAGQRQDLAPVEMPDFAALHEYCYRVASVVGVATLYVFGFKGGQETLKLGVDRGIAFQLTNILRDLREDAAPPRCRCYLPADELARFGVTAEALARGQDSPAYRELMAFQVARARQYYQRSAELEQRVEADARPTLAAMTAIYRGILEKIAARPGDVLRGAVRLSTWAKLRIGWRAMRGHYLCVDDTLATNEHE